MAEVTVSESSRKSATCSQTAVSLEMRCTIAWQGYLPSVTHVVRHQLPNAVLLLTVPYQHLSAAQPVHHYSVTHCEQCRATVQRANRTLKERKTDPIRDHGILTSAPHQPKRGGWEASSEPHGTILFVRGNMCTDNSTVGWGGQGSQLTGTVH